MLNTHRIFRSSRPLLLGLAFVLLPGCTGAFWGNLLILGVTVGIFVATLSLGQRADGASTAGSTHSRG